MLTVENLHKSYGEKVLFDDVTCTIGNQERIGLIGVNGTGKSSFLKVIAGLDTPESGEIRKPKDYQVEYLSQEPDLNPDLTVIEQIYYGDAVVMKTMRAYEEALLDLQRDAGNQEAQARLMRLQQSMDE